MLTFRDVSPLHIHRQDLFHEKEPEILVLRMLVRKSQMLPGEPFEYGKK